MKRLGEFALVELLRPSRDGARPFRFPKERLT